MPMVPVRVKLREQGNGQEQEVEGGTLIVDENSDAPWLMPCCVPLRPGNHRFYATHPNRTVLPPNPRDVNIVVSTDPDAQEQLVCFDVSSAAPTSPA